jgi:hypothetical protein
MRKESGWQTYLHTRDDLRTPPVTSDNALKGTKDRFTFCIDLILGGEQQDDIVGCKSGIEGGVERDRRKVD